MSTRATTVKINTNKRKNKYENLYKTYTHA